ncbi:hypothetical protein CBR_g16865 [Chara braunii]|uniref:J domain-containing protein n=1 Tax=Chara braunii TaxID=69332 RepID=A0A388KU39_CHABU|nr:hypothetical protein CBR_g16865 [Chara braunii]|eukprot:GBG73522.1 hypothetical protein CBR_g16865 [Chara braunii]
MGTWRGEGDMEDVDEEKDEDSEDDEESSRWGRRRDGRKERRRASGRRRRHGRRGRGGHEEGKVTRRHGRFGSTRRRRTNRRRRRRRRKEKGGGDMEDEEGKEEQGEALKKHGSELDYYAILGIPSSSTLSDVRSAYRKLALKYHPDKSGAEKEAIFKYISTAYRILSDPLSRGRYDVAVASHAERHHSRSRCTDRTLFHCCGARLEEAEAKTHDTPTTRMRAHVEDMTTHVQVWRTTHPRPDVHRSLQLLTSGETEDVDKHESKIQFPTS